MPQREVFFFFLLRSWIPVSVSICGSGLPLCARRSKDRMEMCNVAGENCTRSRKGEVQLVSANGIGYKLSRELRFFWDPHCRIPP